MANIDPDPEATITLLKLHPDKDHDAPLRCETWPVALVAEPEYEALSYVWGDPAISDTVELNGQAVQISQNLSSALRRLRQPDTPLTLWIDQLCIDQQNAAEKSRQVTLMRHIYSGCRLCHVWIGELPHDVSLQDASWIFDALEYMADYAAAEESGCRPLPHTLARTTDYEGVFRGLAVLSGADESRQEVSWWSRIWTIQEAILPHELRVMWGPLSMTWGRMSDAVLSLTTDEGDPGLHEFLHSLRNRSAWGILIANFAWVYNFKIEPSPALALVFQWRHRNATDPRDKAYAIMGLCHGGDLPRTEQCNYGLPASRVFTNLTVDLILLEKNLKPLAADLKSENSSLPGWTFNVSHTCDYETDWHYIFSYDDYAACGPNTLDCVSFEKRMAKEPDVLQIPGSYADTIAHLIGEPMVQNRHDHSVGEDYHPRLKNWHSLGKQHCHNEFAFWEDFGRTMIGDLDRNGEQRVESRATTDDVRNVYEFLNDGDGDRDFVSTMMRNTANQVFFITKTGLLGLGPLDTRAGDEVWVLDGGNMPFVLRRRSSKPAESGEEKLDGGTGIHDGIHMDEVDFDYGGKCYVHGLMSGQLITGMGREPQRTMVRMH